MDEGRKRVIGIMRRSWQPGSSVNWRAPGHPRLCIRSSRMLWSLPRGSCRGLMQSGPSRD